MLDNLEAYPQIYRPFVGKLQAAIEEAKAGGNKREFIQLNKILDAVTGNTAIKMLNFWSVKVKALANEWDDVRVEHVPEDVATKRKYREFAIEDGQNPFRVNSKNYKIFELLKDGGLTKEAIAEKSGADIKTVGYALWLIRRNGYVVERDSSSKTFQLKLPDARVA